MLPGVIPCNTRQVHVTNYLPGGGEGKYFYLEGFSFSGHDHDDGVKVDVFIHEEGTPSDTWKRVYHNIDVSTGDGQFCGDNGNIYGVSYHNFYGNPPKIAHTNPTDDRCNETSRVFEIYPKNTNFRIDKIRMTFKLGSGNTDEKHVHIKQYNYKFSGSDLLKINGYVIDTNGEGVSNVDVRVKNGGSVTDPNNFKYTKTDSKGFFSIDPSGLLTTTAPYYNVTVIAVPNIYVFPPVTQWGDYMGQCSGTGGPFPPHNAYECQNLTIPDSKVNCTLRGCNFVVTPKAAANNPPVCGAVSLTKVPNKTYYLPNEVVSLTAGNFTDANNDPVIVTNWTSSSGVLTNISSDKLSASYRLPSASNQSSTVSYVISDGKSNTTCSTTFTTKLMFSCTNNACIQDSNGSYNTLSDCMLNCSEANKMYSCNADGQCVLDPTNGVYSSSDCNNACGAQQVTCNNINVVGDISIPGNPVKLSASVSNFTNTGAIVYYSWVSEKGTIDISNDPNCNKNTKVCTMNSNLAYTTAPVDYISPFDKDTIYFKINNSNIPSCILNIDNSSQQKNISLNFEQSSYSINTGTNTSVNLLVLPLDDFNSYALDLICSVNSTGEPCPSGSYKFTENSTEDLLLENIEANQTYTKNITLDFPNSTEVTLSVFGNSVPSSPSLERSASTNLNVVSTPPLDYSVKYNSGFLNSKSDYCSAGTGTNFDNIVLYLIAEGSEGSSVTSYDLSMGQTLPLTINPGNYTISANLKEASLPKEIKCVKVNGTITESNSTNFNVVSAPINITYIVGPVEGNTWYQAFGGSAFSKGGFINPIVDTTQKILANYANTSAGVLQTNSVLNIPQVSSMPEKYVIYPASDSLTLNHLQKLTSDLNASNVTKINNVSQIQYGDDNNFYYYEGNLNITSNLIAPPGKKIPVVYISGDIYIESSVTQLDLYLITDKSITLGSDSAVEFDLKVKGAIIARNSFNFKSLTTVPDVNGKLAEKIYFDPSIYFSNSPNSKFFKNVNIFANLID